MPIDDLPMDRLVTHLLRTLVLLLVSPGLVLANPMNLPDMGSPSDAALSKDREAQIGRMVLRQLRDAGMVMEDPLVDEYIQNLGQRLAGHAHDGDFRFRFFVVDDGAINAFAMPGGYIGINRGLIDASRNESELAGVVAHEIAHVTQRHISRSIAASQRTSIIAAAAMLAAVVLGAAGGGDAAMGAMAMGQSYAIEQQIAHTRANEYEADRIGIGVLASAGFDPEGMPRFFEVLQRRYGFATAGVPEFLRTHPVTTDRIAEGLSRARQLERPDQIEDSLSYRLTKARLRVLSSPTPEAARNWFEDEMRRNDATDPGLEYGLALASLRQGQSDLALLSFRSKVEAQPEIIQYHIGLAQAYQSTNDLAEAIAVYENAVRLFPRNLPLVIHYAEALLSDNRPAEAHAILLDLLNTVPPTPEQIRLIAMAASASGEVAEAHYYMAEFHIVNGNAPLAVNQLRMALAAPTLNPVQRARFEARIDWIFDNVPDELRRELERQMRMPEGSVPR
ncbi:MAG: M48 family metallopeptidase [Gammaproteobacteria bacterium]|nr:M48 family metallopeptidase [Gammaproteobacteria bacterium]